MNERDSSVSPVPISNGMVRLGIPTDGKLLTAAGKLACAAGTHELMLKYLFKQITCLELNEALWATNRNSAEKIRKRCRMAFVQKTNDAVLIGKLDSLLNHSRELTEQRNHFLHRGWAFDHRDILVTKDENQNFTEAPKSEDLDTLTETFQQLTYEINEARLRGFIVEVIAPKTTPAVSSERK